MGPRLRSEKVPPQAGLEPTEASKITNYAVYCPVLKSYELIKKLQEQEQDLSAYRIARLVHCILITPTPPSTPGGGAIALPVHSCRQVQK